MRESIGATWIFSICLTFIVLFTAYLAISVNYAKAFRIKSYIVSKIEENEGYDEKGPIVSDIENYLVAQGYNASGTCGSEYDSNFEESNWGEPMIIPDGTTGRAKACIYRQQVGSTIDDIDIGVRAYYKVVVFFKFDLPVVNYLTTFKVKGDTKLIYDCANTTSGVCNRG